MFMLYVTSVIVSFVAVFLKGFQHKNVIGDHRRSVFFTSYLMAVFDVVAVTLIVKGGWPIAFTSGTGAAFGMLAAIHFHDRLFKDGAWFHWDDYRTNSDGEPAMYTKDLFTLRGWRWSLHKFVRRDNPRCYHSHPAEAYRIILWGSYEELVMEEHEGGKLTIKDIKTWSMGAHGKVKPTHIHALISVKVPTFTLWIRGPKTHEIRKLGEGWDD